jgi:SulP family sulfate permease
MIGVPLPRSQVLQDYLVSLFPAIPRIHFPSFATGLAALCLLIYLPKFKHTKRIPAPLIVVVFMIVIFSIVMTAGDDAGLAADGSFATRAGIGLVGTIPSDFPTLRIPTLRADRFMELLSTAISVTFVGFIERCATFDYSSHIRSIQFVICSYVCYDCFYDTHLQHRRSQTVRR